MTPEQTTIRILLDILAERGGITQQDRDRLSKIMDMHHEPQPYYPTPFNSPRVEATTCNKCGRVFEYGKVYNLVCGIPGCPTGFGGLSCTSEART